MKTAGEKRMAETDRVMSEQRSRPEAQSAAAPSPFPAIADYAFLSNCHTGALVAPDGSVDWLCVPRFDGPSIFGALLDRQAGSFRLGPFGVNVPSARIYEPGTNTLVTTWNTETGWILVRDALTMGPRHGDDSVTPHTRPPTDEDGDHVLVRTVICLEGSVELELVCEPAFDYGRTPAEWTLVQGDGRHSADATGAGQTVRLHTDMALGIEGERARARHTLRRASRCTARCRGPRISGVRSTSTTRMPASPRRRCSGAGGSPARARPTTAGARSSSARRSRSRD